LQANQHEFAIAVPGAWSDFGGDGKWCLSAIGLRVAVVEVVDEFFNPNGVAAWQPPGVDGAARIGIRRRVNVDGKR